MGSEPSAGRGPGSAGGLQRTAVSCRLLIDCMGHYSPIVQQVGLTGTGLASCSLHSWFWSGNLPLQLTTLPCLTPKLNLAAACRCQAISLAPDQTVILARLEARWCPLQIRGSHKPPGMCLVVGGCAEGLPAEQNRCVPDLILLGLAKAAVLCHFKLLHSDH